MIVVLLNAAAESQKLRMNSKCERAPHRAKARHLKNKEDWVRRARNQNCDRMFRSKVQPHAEPRHAKKLKVDIKLPSAYIPFVDIC